MTDVPISDKPDSDEFIVHWAQWFAITYWQLFNSPAGTDERRKAYNLHTNAGLTLLQSVGISNHEARHD